MRKFLIWLSNLNMHLWLYWSAKNVFLTKISRILWHFGRKKWKNTFLFTDSSFWGTSSYKRQKKHLFFYNKWKKFEIVTPVLRVGLAIVSLSLSVLNTIIILVRESALDWKFYWYPKFYNHSIILLAQ